MKRDDYACAVDFFDVKLWKNVIDLCLAKPANFWQELFGCDESHPEFNMVHIFTDQQIKILQGELAQASIDPNVGASILVSWQIFNSAFGIDLSIRNKTKNAYYICFDLDTPLDDKGHAVDSKWLKISKLMLLEYNGILSIDVNNANDYSTVADQRWDYLRAIFKNLGNKLYGYRYKEGSSHHPWMRYLSNIRNNALENIIILL
jgi:hypothetical protein